LFVIKKKKKKKQIGHRLTPIHHCHPSTTATQPQPLKPQPQPL
jgi:hypothetical protein